MADKVTDKDFDSLWDYSDPAASEQRFRELLEAGGADVSDDWRRQLLTQIARAQGLQRAFDAAHETLDRVEAELETAAPVVRIRYLLERGRVFNSSGHPEQAKPLFRKAWELGCEAGEDGFAVDAAHMLGIVEPPDEALEWNRKALELATSSDQERAKKWAGSLHNNIGWTHFGNDDYTTALEHFKAALECRQREGKPDEIPIARWCIARTLRALGQIDEALAMQRELSTECEAAGRPDGYVSEELGECLLALGQTADARPHFAKAWEQLSKDSWLAEKEPDRIARLKELGGDGESKVGG